MADNATYQSGTLATLPSGLIVATDEISGTLEHAQVIKVAVSADGDRTLIPADSANGLDVDVTRAPGQAADGGTLPAVLYVVGGFDGTNVQALAVNASGQAQVGVTNFPAVQPVSDNGGSLTVDGNVGITGAVDTELTTADLDTGAGTDTRAVVGLARAESGGGVLVGSANPLPVTTQVPVPVSDNGGSLTVDGNVGITGSVDTELPAAVALADNMANPTAPQVGAHILGWRAADSQWDRIGMDSAGALMVSGRTSGGGSTATVLPLHIAGRTETPEDTAPQRESSDGVTAFVMCSRDGALYTHPHPPQIWHASNEYTTQQTDAVVKAAPGAGLSLYITDIFLACNAAVNVTLEEDQVTDVLKWKYYASGQGDGAAVNLGVPIKLAANAALLVTTSAAVTVTLVVTGYTAP